MTPKEFYTNIMEKADTKGTKINAAEVSRVLHLAFRTLSMMDPVTAFEVLYRCLAAARKKDRC